MKRILGLLAALAPCLSILYAQAPPSYWLDKYRGPADRIITESVSNNAAWNRLAELTDTFGPRLSGSSSLEEALKWSAETMKQDGLEHVRLEPVMVPHWVRGKEHAEIVQPVKRELVMLGLGGSIGTGPNGVEAAVLVVRTLQELDAKAEAARGKIVVLNAPFTHYPETIHNRTTGPSRAARHGAVALLVRSVAPPGYRTAHTGATNYARDAPRIPAAAITSEDADQLQRMFDRGLPLRIRLYMEAETLPDAPSANVVAELRGSVNPEQIVVLAAHLDSWDVGTGASDDGGGAIAVWEAVRLLAKLNLRARRTIRVVLFTNEENGERGAYTYRDQHRAELDDHVMMLESDTGVFGPTGFGFTGSARARARVSEIASLLHRIGATSISAVGGGADINPSVQVANVPSMSLEVDGTRFFLIHHTAADTVDKIEPLEIAQGAAAVAVMAYVVADMPERLDEQ